GRRIDGLEHLAGWAQGMVFHAGTRIDDGRLVTDGGRVLGVTALGDTIDAAVAEAYAAVDRLRWPGMHVRPQIGHRAPASGAARRPGGAAAASAALPGLGGPVASTPLRGLDALLATVQMPGGVPVATVAIGRSGAENAGVLAAQILALRSRPLRERLERFKTELAESVEGKNLRLQRKISPESND